MSRLEEMQAALRDANATLYAADCVASTIARMLVGRLRRADCATLAKLKRELRDFNMHTGTWKN